RATPWRGSSGPIRDTRCTRISSASSRCSRTARPLYGAARSRTDDPDAALGPQPRRFAVRHLTREKAESWQLLERAKTIAVLGPATAPRRGTTVAYLRRVGYDVRLIRTFALANVGGPIDLVLVFGRVPDLAALLRA